MTIIIITHGDKIHIYIVIVISIKQQVTINKRAIMQRSILTILIPGNIWLIGTWPVVKIMTCFATNIGLRLFFQLCSNKFPIEMLFPLMQLKEKHLRSSSNASGVHNEFRNLELRKNQ